MTTGLYRWLRTVALVTLTAALAGATLAAPIGPQPISRNLAYLRARNLSQDLPTALSRKGALILDLRYLRAEADAIKTFAAWLKAQARPQAPVFVLVNTETTPALRTLVDPVNSPAGVLSVGPEAEALKVDIAVHVSTDADREAYDALEKGTPLLELIDRKLDKERRDQASFARNRPATAPIAPSDATAEATPPPPIDAVLQRAVQLHRALVALRKVPGE